jgi:hypothetical protein
MVTWVTLACSMAARCRAVGFLSRRRTALKRFSVLATVLVVTLMGCDAHVRGVIPIIGDSNVVLGANHITHGMADRSNGYVPVMFATSASGIKTSDCASSCATYNFWGIRLGEGLAKVQSDALVVELGVNDANEPGTADGPGYLNYDAKIDYLMGLLPSDKPVLWTNLPCTIEPPGVVAGCAVVNTALASASARWSNLTVLDWFTASTGHPEYIKTNDVHYTAAGYIAWTDFVVDALDSQLPDPSAPTTTTSTTAPDTTTTTPDTTTTTTDTLP